MTKDEYYLGIALAVAKKSTCLKKQYGAVIVNNDEIISTGYNNTCRKEPHCTYCTKIDYHKDEAEYLTCPAVHAEQNAIISAPRKDMIGATLYEVGIDVKTGKYAEKAMPCAMCKRFIINSGITTMVFRDDKENYRVINVQDLINNDDSLEGTLGY